VYRLQGEGGEGGTSPNLTVSTVAREPLSKTWAGSLFVCLGVLILDRLGKFIVQKTISLGESIEILGDFFRLTYIYNPGGVFGLSYGGDLFYLLFSIVAILFIVYYYYIFHHRHRDLRLPLALVVGGALGNLIDRLWFGEVLDFLDFDIPDINIPDFNVASLRFPGLVLERWPVFNVADSAITVGVFIIIILFILRPERKIQDKESS
jgi:signal peptidase II